MTGEQAERVAPLLEALADPVRLRLVSLIVSAQGGVDPRVRPLLADPHPAPAAARPRRPAGDPAMSGTPSVLFVCVHNAGRSQMAAGWLRHLAGDAVEVRSAGSLPGDRLNPSAVAAMAEVGIDITDQRPTVLTPEAVEASDVVITMGCGDACPVFPGKRYLDWELEDPAGRGVETVRPIRDEIEARIRGLLADLRVGPATTPDSGDDGRA